MFWPPWQPAQPAVRRRVCSGDRSCRAARTRQTAEENLDMIAANEVGHDKAFDCEDNQLIVLWAPAGAICPGLRRPRSPRQLVALIAESYLAARTGIVQRGSALA